MVLRMEMRWAERRGFERRAARGQPGGGGRHQVRHLPRQGRERLRPVRGREGRAPARAPVAVRLRPPPPDVVRRRRGRAGGRGRRRGRDRRRRPADRHLPRVGRRRPARQQDRLGGAHHPPADRHRRPVPERALAVVQQGDRDGDAALQARRARGAQAPEEIAQGARRGAGRQLRLADPLLRPAPVHDGQGPPHGRRDGRRQPRARRRPRRLRARLPAAQAKGEPPRWPLRRPLRAGHHRPGRGRAQRPADRALPRRGRRLRLPRLDALPRARPQGRRRRRPRAALRARRGRADARRPAGHRRDRPRARRRRRTSAPSSSPPRPTARARSWFLTNGATQGNHALCLALAPLGAPVVVQRNSHASVVDGLVLCGGMPDASSRPSTSRSSAWPTASRRRRSPRRSRATPGRARRVHRLADVLRHGRRRRRLRRGLPRRRRRRSSSTRRGARTSASTPTCRRARSQQGADAVLTSTHKIVGSLTQSAMLHVAPTGRDRPRRGRARGAARALARRRRRCCWRRSTPRAASSRSTAQALLARTIAAAAARAQAIDAIPGCRVVGDELVGQPGVAGWDPLRIVIDVRGTGCTGYEVADGAALGLRHPRRARHARDARARARRSAQPPDDARALRPRLRETVRRIARPGDARGARARPGRARQRDRRAAARGVPRRRRRSSRSTTPSAASRRVDRRLPAGHPGAAAGRAHHRGGVAYLRELRDAGARLHGASDPDFRTIVVLVRRALTDDALIEARARARTSATAT